MRRAALLIAVLLTAAGGASASTARAAAPAAPAPASAPGQAPADTGNLLVLLDQAAPSGTLTRDIERGIRGIGGRPAGKSVPEIGLITVRPPAGTSPSAFAARLRSLPGIASVQEEQRYTPRLVPNDPALRALDPSAGVPWQWYLAREGFYQAWNVARGQGALVAVIDTGIDGSHPDLRPRIAAAIDQQSPSASTGPADTDQVGHGTDVASLACADTDNGLGMAGAGYDCRMLIEKTDFSDSSIAASIVDATNRHVKAINMSFGPSVPGSGPPPRSEVRALRYAAGHKVVLVAAASDSPGTNQGDPGDVLQPAGTGRDIAKGLGLDVTAAQYSGARAPFAGSGSEISLAAYGAFRPGPGLYHPCNGRRAGIFGAFPGNRAQLEQFPPAACRVDFQGDDRYATIAGTSMAAPQVTAVGAMMRVLNPYASLADILRIIKRTARRPRHVGWTPNLGWGILDAAAALRAIRRVDRLAPVSHLVARFSGRTTVLLTWSGHDQRRPGLIASGIAHFDLYVSVDGGRRQLITRTGRRRFAFAAPPSHRYTFFLFAVDRAGNRQLHASRVTVGVMTSGAGGLTG